MKHKITDRQLVALLAVYFGEQPSNTPSRLYGEGHAKAGTPVWVSHTNMGGSIRRMTEGLREAGFLSDWDHHSLSDKPYYERGNQLTVKGYEAIEERLGKLPKVKDWASSPQPPPFDFNAAIRDNLVEFESRKAARAHREAEIIRLRREEHEQAKAHIRAAAERIAAQRLTKLRALFSDRGLADNWSDDELLGFAEEVASL